MASLIERVLKRAKRCGADPDGYYGGTTWYEISSRDAGQLVREAWGADKKPPRMAYQMDLLPTTYRGHKGRWMVTNLSGKYEIQFYYA